MVFQKGEEHVTDEELLRYAAKAAGFVEPHSYRPKTNSLLWLAQSGFPATWKPFDDDAEAFKLMVDLKLFVFHGWTYAQGEDVPLANVVVDNAEQTVQSGEIKGDDPHAATRRAIVRAAAQIGKAMEKNT
jgi:hypothetical protein